MQVDNFLIKLLRIPHSGVRAAFFPFYVADEQIALLNHPTVAFGDGSLGMRFADALGYHYVIIIILVVFHILLRIREDANKLVVCLPHCVLYPFDDRGCIAIKFTLSAYIDLHEGLGSNKVFQQLVEIIIKNSVTVKVPMTKEDYSIGIIYPHSSSLLFTLDFQYHYTIYMIKYQLLVMMLSKYILYYFSFIIYTIS